MMRNRVHAGSSSSSPIDQLSSSTEQDKIKGLDNEHQEVMELSDDIDQVPAFKQDFAEFNYFRKQIWCPVPRSNLIVP